MLNLPNSLCPNRVVYDAYSSNPTVLYLSAPQYGFRLRLNNHLRLVPPECCSSCTWVGKSTADLSSVETLCGLQNLSKEPKMFFFFLDLRAPGFLYWWLCLIMENRWTAWRQLTDRWRIALGGRGRLCRCWDLPERILSDASLSEPLTLFLR